MANTVAKQTLHNGDRNLVVKVNITGDGSGEETATQIVDVSAFSGYNVDWTEVRVDKAQWSNSGVSLTLLWDATTDVAFLECPAGDGEVDFRKIGGLINNAGSGVTGDIMVTTVGLGSGDQAMIVLEMVKRKG